MSPFRVESTTFCPGGTTVFIVLLMSATGFLSAAPEFNRDVRPILAEHCFRCHGADAKARKGELRLDVREEAIAKKALVPGDVEHSALWERITTADADDVMPPSKEPRLSEQEKAVLRQWIHEGAGYEKHWAFLPPQPPPVPAGAQHPVDAFVQEGLMKRGLQPAPAAAPEQWLRRVSFALTGLPPSLEALDAFRTDSGPDARARIVERLLDSPAYGEHLAKDWLDAARYADSYGRHEDGDMVAWPWRDWVIRSFNSNLPYDQFIQWQTAGDLLPDPQRDQWVATFFNRLSPQSNESGNDPLEFRLDQVSDRVRANGLAFMGLTMECAKCHDHKYDPITQKEYWQMAAFFDNIEENGVYSQFCPKTVPSPSITLPTEEQSLKLAADQQKITAIEKELERIAEESKPGFERWVADHGLPGTQQRGWWNSVKSWFGQADMVPWPMKAAGRFSFELPEPGTRSKTLPNRADKDTPGKLRVKLDHVDGPEGQAALLKGDDEITFEHKIGDLHCYQPFSFALWLQPREKRERAVVLSWSRGGIDDGRGYEVVLNHEVPEFALMHFQPGNEIRIRAKAALPLDQWTHVAFTYDGSSRASGLKMWVNGDLAATERVHDHLHKDIVRREAWGDIDLEQVEFKLGGRFHDQPLKNCAVDEFCVFHRELSSGEVRHLAHQPAKAEDWHAWWLRAEHHEWRQLEHALLLHRKHLTEHANDLLEIMVMQERPQRRPSFIRIRGDHRQPGEAVEPGTPREVLPFADSLRKDRLGFAQWLTDPQNPLTARVAVNRFWKLAFGTGLVRTPEDFGTRGGLPTHPGLLDWLACDFMKHGWDVKRLMRQLVLSETFAQGCTPADPRLLETDPDNLLLARFGRIRVNAEELRDQALVAADLLSHVIGGPSVHTYLPPGAYHDAGLQQPQIQDHGEKLHRRSLYSFWRRTLPPPELAAFDAPSREFCVVKRETTTSPTQALMLLNQTQFVEAQRVLAEQLVRNHPDDPQARAVKAFRLFTSRTPTPAELEVLGHLMEHQRSHYQQHQSDANALLTQHGDTPADTALPAVEVATTAVMVRALMSHDEALHR